MNNNLKSRENLVLEMVLDNQLVTGLLYFIVAPC